MSNYPQPPWQPPNYQAGYQQRPGPYQYGYPMMVAPPSNTIATVGMVLGIISLLSVGILAIPALVVSLVGLQKANELGGLKKTDAVTGVITSAFGLVIGVALLIVYMAANTTY